MNEEQNQNNSNKNVHTHGNGLVIYLASKFQKGTVFLFRFCPLGGGERVPIHCLGGFYRHRCLCFTMGRATQRRSLEKKRENVAWNSSALAAWSEPLTAFRVMSQINLSKNFHWTIVYMIESFEEKTALHISALIGPPHVKKMISLPNQKWFW